jgi:hypothetical protein
MIEGIGLGTAGIFYKELVAELARTVGITPTHGC